MKKLWPLVVIASVISAGCDAMTVWLLVRHSDARTHRFVLGPPCRGGLVSVNVQPDCPVQITIADTACDKTRVTTVNFIAENISTSPITEIQIRAIETYDEIVDQGISVAEIGTLHPNQTRGGFIGGGVITTSCGKPVGPLRQYQLTISSVTFADGKTWSRELPHNKSLDASRDSLLCMKLL